LPASKKQFLKNRPRSDFGEHQCDPSLGKIMKMNDCMDDFWERYGASPHMPKARSQEALHKGRQPRTSKNRVDLFEHGISLVACPLHWWKWRSCCCELESSMKSRN